MLEARLLVVLDPVTGFRGSSQRTRLPIPELQQGASSSSTDRKIKTLFVPMQTVSAVNLYCFLLQSQLGNRSAKSTPGSSVTSNRLNASNSLLTCTLRITATLSGACGLRIRIRGTSIRCSPAFPGLMTLQAAVALHLHASERSPPEVASQPSPFSLLHMKYSKCCFDMVPATARVCGVWSFGSCRIRALDPKSPNVVVLMVHSYSL